jgi:hypothetical protein
MDQASAQFQLLQEAKQEIDSVGVNAALAGVDERSMSGVALRRYQQGASTELKPLFESIAQFDTNVCRAVWQRIKQFWTAEKWIRVTGDAESPKWIGLNVPITDHAGNVIVVKNNVAEIDVDFSMIEVPDVVNSQQEQFETLAAIYPSIPEEMKSAAFELLLESSTLRNKKKVIERLKGKQDPAAAELQRKLAELQAQLLEAKVALTNAHAEKAKSAATVDNVETLYSAMQTAQVAATVRGVVPIADEIAKSAGFVDQNSPPLYPQPVPPAPAAMGQPVPPAPSAIEQQPMVRQNTNPMFTAHPISPGEGMMKGIETERNDGVRVK